MADWFNTTRLSVMNVDGSGPRALVDNAVFHDRFGYDRTPWSPNGQWIYYMTQDGHYVIDATAASPRRIAGADFRGGFNGWSPRGDRIAFTVNENGMQNIFVMNADGTGVVNLTNGASHNTQAIWLRR
jgi:TolB protein